jgi:hypothetical protein
VKTYGVKWEDACNSWIRTGCETNWSLRILRYSSTINLKAEEGHKNSGVTVGSQDQEYAMGHPENEAEC